MILLDKPYVSDFLLDSIRVHNLPVVLTPYAAALGLADAPGVVAEGEARRRLNAADTPVVYTNSEHALDWLAAAMPGKPLPRLAAVFKDKAGLRRLLADMYPWFTYRQASLAELARLDPASLEYPVILKPNVGFFSLAVHKVNSPGQWAAALRASGQELSRAAGLYPETVLSQASFIIEQYVEGAEYAVDAYFDHRGAPVILSILHHEFASAEDVGDRVYVTSRQVVEDNIDAASGFLAEVGRRTGAVNMPVHVEFRKLPGGQLFPIEVNPLRFGGWCTTADLAWHAYGFNPYQYVMEGRVPDWPGLLAKMDGAEYGLIVLNNSTGYGPEQIASFNYNRLLAGFARPLELRRFDHRQYHFFGFLFTQTRPENRSELDSILTDDLVQYVTLSR